MWTVRGQEPVLYIRERHWGMRFTARNLESHKYMTSSRNTYANIAIHMRSTLPSCLLVFFLTRGYFGGIRGESVLAFQTAVHSSPPT